MRNHLEATTGIALVSGAEWIASHYDAFIGAVTLTAIASVWIIKAVREWRHRGD